MKTLLILLLSVSVSSCAQTSKKDKEALTDTTPAQTSKTKKGYKKAYFSSGCFWCSESIYESVLGVKKVIPGYAGGKGKNPTYENYSKKGHAETVEVIYDPSIIDFETLLVVYFNSQNVTQDNGQGPDQGSGYRSIVFYQNEKEEKTIKEKIKEVQKNYKQPVAAEVKPFKKFWVAEEYHHNYEKNNPDNPYIKNVSLPRLYQFQRKNPDLLKKNN